MTLQLIRNATLKIRIAERTLLVDPYLAARHAGASYAGRERSPLVPLPLPVPELLADVDAVFVSHLHSDHFDQAARAVLAPDSVIFCPAALVARLRAFGFRNVTGIDEWIQWAGARLTLTGGRHGPDSVLLDMGAVNGFVVQAPALPTLYWAGDTIWCTEVRAAVDRFNPAVIVVHACGATWLGRGPLVMDAADVQSLLEYDPTCRVIATHMDCVDHATVSRADLAQHFAALPSLRSRLLIPADGERLPLAG